MNEVAQIFPFSGDYELLCSGDAAWDKKSKTGNFWAESPVPLKQMQDTDLLLRMKDGSELKINQLRAGLGTVTNPRYDFKVVQVVKAAKKSQQ
jgi:hypothetical protein